jgi:5-methylcytosine-specific restriction endonuclease McrA
MNVYDDTPETAPRVQSMLPSKGAATRKIRSSKEYQNVRQQYLFRAQHHRNVDGTIGERCWLCGEPIDYRLKFPHPRSWSLDHAIPISENPALMLNSSNFRSSHLDCNNHRQSDAPRIEMGEPSEVW